MSNKDSYEDSASYCILFAIVLLIVLFMAVVSWGAYMFADIVKAIGG